MADNAAYALLLIAWLGQALGDSASLFASFSTDALGLALPAAVLEAPSVVAALKQAEARASAVRAAATELEAVARTAADDRAIYAALLREGAALDAFYAALAGLTSAVRGSVSPTTVPDATARAAADTFAASLAKRLSDYALASVLTDHTPEFALLLTLAGLLEWRWLPVEAGHELSRAHVRKVLHLERFRALISEPGAHFRRSIGWGEASFDPTPFFRIAAAFFTEADDVDVGLQAGEPFLRLGSLLMRRDGSVAPPGLLLAFLAGLDADHLARSRLSEAWGGGVSSTLRLTGSVSGRVTPPLTLRLRPATGQLTGSLRLFVDRNEDARPFNVLGGTGLLSIAATNVTAGVQVTPAWSASAGEATVDPLLFATIDGVAVKLGTAEADGFIGRLLSAAQIAGEFDLGLEWQAATGLRVTASGGIEIALPVHKHLGPVELQTLYLALRILKDGTLSLEVSTALAGSLGPLTVLVDRMGALLDLRFADGASAAPSGPFDLHLRFQAPWGVGLAIDAGVIKGGGFLRFDPTRKEYSGTLELTARDVLTLKAIGLITTRMPDGSSGFSLLVIITAEFGTGIQLGFGFTLLAVGGLLGLNRTMKLQPLLEGVRTGALTSILFPQNVVANAPKLISDLRVIFPPQEGTFLVGPMAKLSWGTPPLLRLTLGIIIEIPGNVAILGVLKVALPADDVAVLVLQVNFVGAIEFATKRVFFFAALFESRILFLPIDGEMGLLLALGEDATFVVSVGGFHPQFTPPPLPFPSPRRVSISLVNSAVARVRVEGYFALTSNTVQFGARAELYFGLDAINVEGDLGFDALFQFSPFHFIISLSASFSVKVFGVGLFSVRVRGNLEGPTPWRAHGEATISLLVHDIPVNFDVTWGERRATELPPIAVMPLFKAEFAKRDTWRALPPPGNGLRVTLRTLPSDESGLVLHPVGVLRITQRLLPLDLTVDKDGNQKPSDVNRLSVAVVGGGLAKKGDTLEQFAPAQFQDMSDAEKLSRPAYGPQHGGLDLAAPGDDLRSSGLVKRVVRYEAVVLDTNAKRFVRRLFTFSAALFTHFLSGASVKQSELSQAKQRQLQPFAEQIAVHSETYTVAYQATNKAYAAATVSFASEASARDYLARAAVADPNLSETLHVIPSYERAL